MSSTIHLIIARTNTSKILILAYRTGCNITLDHNIHHTATASLPSLHLFQFNTTFQRSYNLTIEWHMYSQAACGSTQEEVTVRQRAATRGTIARSEHTRDGVIDVYVSRQTEKCAAVVLKTRPHCSTVTSLFYVLSTLESSDQECIQADVFLGRL